ncbi:T9SS type A sorting domain-containing protein [Flavobacterium sp.]|uniref:T9SS type A sorting domain-containing protein n=1 Tax=Flavobacterium sp. TaxID=239 RepID=UPI003B9BCF85
MKKISSLLAIISSSLLFAQAPTWNWVKQSTGAINEAFACVTTDANGNVFAGGSIISETADFGLGPVTTNGSADYSIIKYDTAGTPLWMRNGGGVGNEVVFSLTTDAENNIYALVRYESPTVTFGNFTLNCTLGSIGGSNPPLPSDVALVKYDTNGTVLWVKKIGGAERESSSAISIDSSGNVYVSAFSESNNTTVGSSSIVVGSNSFVGAFLAKFDASGNVLWIKRFGNDNIYDGCRLSGLVFDDLGNFYLTGGFSSDTFTLGSTTYTNTAQGGYDSFIAKLDPAGNILEQKLLQGTVDDSFGGVVKVQNELFVPFDIRLYQISNSATYSFDGVDYSTTTSTGGLFKLDLNLQFLGLVPNINFPGTVFTDGATLYLAGNFFEPTRTFGDFTLTNTNSSTTVPTGDIFIANMDTSGQFLWAKSAGGTGSDDPLGFAIDTNANIYAAGYFNSSPCTFDSFTINNTSEDNYLDAFVAKLNSAILSNTDLNNEKVALYPNPTQNEVHIESANLLKKVIISDVNGRILDTQFEKTVNLTNLNTGIYFLTIETESGISSHKIIKQ